MTISELIDILQFHGNKLGDCEIEDKGQITIHEKE